MKGIAGGEYRRYHCRNRRIEALLEVSGGVDRSCREAGERDALVGGDEPRQIAAPSMPSPIVCVWRLPGHR